MTRRRALVAGGLALLVPALVACSGDPAAEPAPETKAPAATATASAGAFASACEDAAGDGDGGADIERVELRSDGQLVYLTFTMGDGVGPDDFDQVSFLATAFSSDGERGYQFGTQFIGGSETGNFVFDFVETQQKNYDTGAVFADGTVSVRYPAADLAQLGTEFTWHASTSVDGVDADLCGGPLDEAIAVTVES